MTIENDPKLLALVQLLGGQAADKVVAEILTSLTPEQKLTLAREFMTRWSPEQLTRNSGYSTILSDTGKVLDEMFRALLKERADDLKSMMLAKLDEMKKAWVAETVNRVLGSRGY